MFKNQLYLWAVTREVVAGNNCSVGVKPLLCFKNIVKEYFSKHGTLKSNGNISLVNNGTISMRYDIKRNDFRYCNTLEQHIIHIEAIARKCLNALANGDVSLILYTKNVNKIIKSIKKRTVTYKLKC
jgi:hypothetical protein